MDAITDEDVNYAREILSVMYGDQFAQTVDINEYSLGLIAEMLIETGKCSDDIDLVPKTPGYFVKPGLKYVLKIVRQVGKEIMLDPAKKSYLMCDRVIFRSRQAAFI